MANNSIYAAFERMWQHITTALAGKSDTSHGHDDIYDAKGSANTALESAKAYTDGVKNDLLNGAGAAYDTLKELGDLIEENKDAIEVLEGIAFNPGSGVPSNWAAEEGEPGHVLNRTHYKTTVETVYVEAQDLNFPWVYGEDYRYKYFVPSTTPVNGDTIIIVFGDETHEAVVEYDEWGYYYFNNIDEDQFSIDWDSENNEIILYSNVTDCSIFKIYGERSTWVQLPEEYISYKPGKIVAGQEFEVNGTAVIANSGAEVFNNYEDNIATGEYSHAEGSYTEATGSWSHAEGNGAHAVGSSSHAEGVGTEARGEYSHAEGTRTIAKGKSSHAEGYYSNSTGENSHAEGYYSIASGENSHAEGEFSIALGRGSHVEGVWDRYIQIWLIATQGSYTYQLEGTYPVEKYEHIFCPGTLITKSALSLDGAKCVSITVADGIITHVTLDRGLNIESDGRSDDCYLWVGPRAIGDGSHAEGMLTVAASDYQHAQGKFNIADNEGKYAHIVGNGESYGTQSNAHTLDWEGNAWFAGDIKVGGTGQDDPNAKILATVDYVDSKAGNGGTYPEATNTTAGLMSAADKAKLDTLPDPEELQNGELVTFVEYTEDYIQTLWDSVVV